MSCLFCRIARKEVPANLVHEDDRAVAFRDINPQATTHVLVIPRTHIESTNAIDVEHEAEVGHLFRVAAEVARKEGIAGRGYRAVLNSGDDAGQTVHHLHVHVIGGKPMGWPPFPPD